MRTVNDHAVTSSIVKSLIEAKIIAVYFYCIYKASSSTLEKIGFDSLMHVLSEKFCTYRIPTLIWFVNIFYFFFPFSSIHCCLGLVSVRKP